MSETWDQKMNREARERDQERHAEATLTTSKDLVTVTRDLVSSTKWLARLTGWLVISQLLLIIYTFVSH